MEMRKIKIGCLVFVLLLSAIWMPKQGTAAEMTVLADAAILVDADSGKILFENKANTPLGIAEMTKMMTTYLVLEAVEKGQLQWEQEVAISNYTYAIAQQDEIRTVNLKKEGMYTVQALYAAMVVYNANDAAVALAETIAGNEAEFVHLMNDKAKELHLSSYKFVNATGLNNSFLLGMHPVGTGPMDENVMSARSMARLAYTLYAKYPDVLNLTMQPELMFNEGSPESFKVSNWNRMLQGFEYSYSTVSGLFGGHSPFAGHSMVSLAERDGQKLVAVVMKAVDETGAESERAMYTEMAKLLDFGFSSFDPVELIPAGYQLEDKESLTVVKGERGNIAVETTEAVTLMLKPEERDLYKPLLLLDVDYIEAPVEKGTLVGKLLLERHEGEDFGFITGEAVMVDVVTSENINGADKMQLLWQGIAAFWRSFWYEANELIVNK